MTGKEVRTVENNDSTPLSAGSNLVEMNLRALDLVERFFQPIYSLSLVLLKEDLARKVTMEALCETLSYQYMRYKGSADVVNIYKIALKKINKQSRQGSNSGWKEESDSNGLLRWINTLNQVEKEFFYLSYLLKLEPRLISAILNVSHGAVETQLGLFRRELSRNVYAKIEQQELGDIASMDSLVQNDVNQIWKISPISTKEQEELAQMIVTCTNDRVQYLKRLRIAKRTLFLSSMGFILLITLTMSIFISGRSDLLSNLKFPSLVSESSKVQLPSPLIASSSSDEIKVRMMNGYDLWEVLWADIQITDYGPASYIGPAKIYRDQIWISQPDQSLELFGIYGQKPNSIYIQNGEEIHYENPVAGEFGLRRSYQEDALFIQNIDIAQMLFPDRGGWFQQESILRPRKTTKIANRKSLLVDWIDAEGRVKEKLWIDSIYGIILKRQVFLDQSEQKLNKEILFNDIRFEEDAPDIRLDEWLALENFDLLALHEMQAPSKGIMTPTPTIGSEIIERIPIPTEGSPVGLNPDQRSLIFQYDQGNDIVYIQDNTAQIDTDLFADGYYLGKIKFGLPWGLRCQRSSDGSRIAFNMGSDGTTVPDYTLRWFWVNEPLIEYQPLSGFITPDFAFSPDGLRLAAFAITKDESQKGIYLIELATGEYKKIIDLDWVESLVWRPDGEYLALIGKLEDEDDLSPMVIHTNTGVIAYQIDMSELNTALYDRWPVYTWDLSFPKPEMGMQSCAEAPIP